MTNEELINKCMDGIIAQGERSMIGTGCVYRGPRGLKCAAGHALEDRFYSVSMEHNPCFDPTVWAALLASGVSDDQKDLMTDMQNIHDLNTPATWPLAKIQLLNQYVSRQVEA